MSHSPEVSMWCIHAKTSCRGCLCPTIIEPDLEPRATSQQDPKAPLQLVHHHRLHLYTPYTNYTYYRKERLVPKSGVEKYRELILGHRPKCQEQSTPRPTKRSAPWARSSRRLESRVLATTSSCTYVSVFFSSSPLHFLPFHSVLLRNGPLESQMLTF